MVDWVRLELDIEKFDDAEFAPYLQRTRSAGTRFTTMAALGDGPEHRQALYELNKTCSADMPNRGTFCTYDEYVTQRIDVDTFHPSGVIIATHGDDWIGMMSHHLPAPRTRVCVLGDERRARTPSRQGPVSRAEPARDPLRSIIGLPTPRVFHHPDNQTAIAMNRRLGFVDHVR